MTKYLKYTYFTGQELSAPQEIWRLPKMAKLDAWVNAGKYLAYFTADLNKVPETPDFSKFKPIRGKTPCLCSRHNELSSSVDPRDAEPDTPCLFCAEKHLATAYSLFCREPGYELKNRLAITGDLGAAERHLRRLDRGVAELIRRLRHKFQLREKLSLGEWLKCAEALDRKIIADLQRRNGKIYIFSNVPHADPIAFDPEDALVFLNKAACAGIYQSAKKILYRRSADDKAYGTERPDCENRVIFGKNGIEKSFIDDLKKSYDWDYEIEKGKVKSMTSGYMVARFLAHENPGKRVILVNFGYKVDQSTYRCPWHNWKFEDTALAEFEHIYTGEFKR